MLLKCSFENMDANQTKSGYELKGDLARLCLPSANRDANRKLAWTNSICFLFLLIGLLGARHAPGFVEPPPRVQQVVRTIVEPPPPTKTTETPKQTQPEDTKAVAPQVVAVTLNTPAINFSVPTVGNLVVPNAIAQAPPPAVLKTEILRINSTGAGGDRPQPPYPPIAMEEAEQGSVTLTLTVNAAGAVTDIQVKESSGYPVLDHAAEEFVKRHWTLPPGNGTRIYEATITYKLALN
jgi:TonB family protein